MTVYSDGKSGSYRWSSEVCRFSKVQPNDELVCDLWASSNNPKLFENETPFILTYANGNQCVGQYHTSCSSDIVGELPEDPGVGLPLCTDVVVSGWRDGNPNDNNNCDDGIEPCSCDSLPPDTSTTTTFVPDFVDIIIGENCYCELSICSSLRTS